MALRRAAIASVSTLAVAGCLSLDGYSGGQLPADAGLQADAPTASDANAAADVVATTPDAGDGGNPACATAFFCDDFERTGDVKGLWDGIDNDAKSSIALTTTTFFTGGSALHVALGTSGNSDAALGKTLPKFSVLDVSYAFYRETETDNTDLGNLTWNNMNGAFTKIFAHLGPTTIAFCEQAFAGGSQVTFNQTQSYPLAANTWVTITMHVDFAAKTYSATVGGNPITTNTSMTASYPNVLPNFQAGTDYSSSATPVSFDVDDVVMQLKP